MYLVTLCLAFAFFRMTKLVFLCSPDKRSYTFCIVITYSLVDVILIASIAVWVATKPGYGTTFCQRDRAIFFFTNKIIDQSLETFLRDTVVRFIDVSFSQRFIQEINKHARPRRLQVISFLLSLINYLIPHS